MGFKNLQSKPGGREREILISCLIIDILNASQKCQFAEAQLWPVSNGKLLWKDGTERSVRLK